MEGNGASDLNVEAGTGQAGKVPNYRRCCSLGSRSVARLARAKSRRRHASRPVLPTYVVRRRGLEAKRERRWFPAVFGLGP